MGSGARSRTILTLFSARDEVTSHRARLVLASKGVVHEQVLVDPARPPEDLLDLNPYGSLPTLVDRDLVLYDINVLSEYLDERYPHPPLMPIDPLSRARIRLAVHRIERDWLSELPQILSESTADAEPARRRLRDGLLASRELFKAAKFFLNTELSLADCALLPLLWRLPRLGIELPAEAKPIRDYAERLMRSPPFQRSLTPEERVMGEP